VNIIEQILRERDDAVTEGVCAICGQAFSDQNVYTELGWKEIKISGLCEDCFDRITEE
jgi:hypothetical protein